MLSVKNIFSWMKVRVIRSNFPKTAEKSRTWERCYNW